MNCTTFFHHPVGGTPSLWVYLSPQLCVTTRLMIFTLSLALISAPFLISTSMIWMFPQPAAIRRGGVPCCNEHTHIETTVVFSSSSRYYFCPTLHLFSSFLLNIISLTCVPFDKPQASCFGGLFQPKPLTQYTYRHLHFHLQRFLDIL